ncbi:MAG: protein-L-isoaspartate O-methyltransferase [endosymbiont of Galathealinum brachiosum]|uniref:Protein-L-isoaspartate O-methyltransferase n=1 Tax=endosymbiont of Galathealinum brachiosum TaxID=2200906 RepID=A0A370DBC9_9GAMM|nr:MAG: protein-L-isoaspartate O-methyltransferase [endosymbiont of Galathealinum brachiosum]
MPSHLDQCRYNMVEQQVRPWDVLDDKVLSTLENIPRDQYVPAQYLNLAYADTAIPLNDTQKMMHPIIEGRILQLLDIQPEDDVLEIGTGSGYLTACLANLACHVETVEIDETLAKKAAQTLLEQGVFNISLSCTNGLDLPDVNNKYDIIVLTGAINEIPQSFKNALTDNGKMFVVDGVDPVMTAHIITRTGDNEWSDETIFETVLTPLVHGEQIPEFKF